MQPNAASSNGQRSLSTIVAGDEPVTSSSHDANNDNPAPPPTTTNLRYQPSIELSPLPVKPVKSRLGFIPGHTHLSQLFWLCVKNLLIRFRHPWHLACEFLFPFLLLTTFVVFRQVEPINKQPDCYFQQQAMPSRGLYRYFQSLLCNFNNTCHRSSQPDPLSAIDDESDMFRLLVHVNDLVNNDQIMNEIESIWTTQSVADAYSLLTKLGPIAKSLRTVNAHFRSLLPASWLDHSKRHRTLNWTQLTNLTRTVSRLACNQPRTDIDRLLDQLDSLMTSSATSSSDSLSSALHVFKSQLLGQFNQSAVNSSTCNLVVSLFSVMRFDQTGDRIKFALFGQIYYYPSQNKIAQAIVNHASSHWWGRLVELRSLVDELLAKVSDPFYRQMLTAKTSLNKFQKARSSCYLQEFAPQAMTDFCHVLHSWFPPGRKIEDSLKQLVQTSTKVLNLISQLLHCIELDNRFLGFTSQHEFETSLDRDQGNSLTSPIGLHFEQLPDTLTDQSLAKQPAIFALRKNSRQIDTTFRYRVVDRLSRPGARSNPSTDMKYFTSGFLDLQELISNAVIDLTMINSSSSSPAVSSSWLDLGLFRSVEMVMFPTKGYTFDKYQIIFTIGLPQLCSIMWGMWLQYTVRYSTEDKEYGMVKLFSSTGIPPGILWLSWIIVCLTFYLIESLLVIMLLRFSSILPTSPPMLLLGFLLSYGLSLLLFGLIFAFAFSQATVAAVVASVVYFIYYLPASALIQYESVLKPSTIIGFAMFDPVVAYCFGMLRFFQLDLLAQQQTIPSGFSWLSSVPTNNYMSIGLCFGLLWLNICLYAAAIFILPTLLFKTTKCFFGLLCRCYALCCVNTTTNDDKVLRIDPKDPFPLDSIYDTLGDYLQSNGHHPDDKNGRNEDVMFRTEDRIQFHQVVKQYNKSPRIPLNRFKCDDSLTRRLFRSCLGATPIGRFVVGDQATKLAVDHLSMSLPSGQITVLLGHNGAGKSTLLGMMTGLVKPSSGRVSVNGIDIAKRRSVAQRSIGYCPQQCLLYGCLTVSEHLKLFELLRGQSVLDLDACLDLLNMDASKLNSRVETLSGGQKRKLSVLLAFVGPVTAILLDEPTASIDPLSKRHIWDIVKALKRDRSIVLSTHLMHETEVLADHVEVMASGRVKCRGSSLALKSQYLLGYRLTVTSSSSSELCKFEQAILDDNCENRLEHTIGSSRQFILPIGSAYNGQLTELLRHLEKLIKESPSSDVFFQISDTSLDQLIESPSPSSATVSHSPSAATNGSVGGAIPVQSMSSPVSTKSSFQCKTTTLLTIAIGTVLAKRYLYVKRHLFLWLFILIVPMFVVGLAVTITSLLRPTLEQPPMDIQPWLITSPQGRTLSTFYSHRSCLKLSSQQLEDAYDRAKTSLSHSLVKPNGWTGPRCLPKSIHQLRPQLDLDCSRPSSAFQLPVDSSTNCSIHPISRPPFWTRLTGNDALINLTDYNIADFLLQYHSATDNRDLDLISSPLYGGLDLQVNPDLELVQLIDQLTSGLEKRIYLRRSNHFAAEAISTGRLFQSLVNSPPFYVRLWYNSLGYVSAPAYLNLLHNLQLRQKPSPRSDGDWTSPSIIVTQHPLHHAGSGSLPPSHIRRMQMDAVVVIFLIFGLSFVVTNFSTFYVAERQNGVYQLFRLAGIRPWVYWTCHFACDLVLYTVAALLCILVLALANHSVYTKPQAVGPFITLCLYYGLAMLPATYALTFLFHRPTTAFVVIGCLNVLLGSITITVDLLLTMVALQHAGSRYVISMVKSGFLLFPQYGLGGAVAKLSLDSMLKVMTGSSNAGDRQSSLWIQLWSFFASLALHCLVWFAIVLLVDYNCFSALTRYLRNHKQQSKSSAVDDYQSIEACNIDDDINHVQSDGDLNTSPGLHVINLIKRYSRRSRLAVDNLTFHVLPGQCFGLLGTNGAGKSTTFAALTGQLTSFEGDILFNKPEGKSDAYFRRAVGSEIGYCPQHDAVDLYATPYEMVSLMGRLRGLTDSNQLDLAINALFLAIELQPFANQPIGTLSGGTKRKVSLALAFIGQPYFMLLDEPSNGMDPYSKRQLARLVQSAQQSGRCILLSSHCMEECEELCDQIGLLVDGRVRCFGSPIELKNRYSIGYVVDMELHSNQSTAGDRLQERIAHWLPDFHLTLPLTSRQSYYFPSERPISTLFHALHQLVEQRLVVRFTVRRDTLEDAFVKLVAKKD